MCTEKQPVVDAGTIQSIRNEDKKNLATKYNGLSTHVKKESLAELND